MPLLAARTLELFGYLLESVTPGAGKKVAAQCERCGQEFVVRRKNLNATCTCRKCTFQLVPRANYARGVAAREATCLERYGQAQKPVAAVTKAKRRATNLTRFGATTPQGNVAVRAKTVATNLARYGTAHPITLPETLAKTRRTMTERYGAPHTLQVPALRAKAAATILARHGVHNASWSPELCAKRTRTILAKFGTLTPRGYGRRQNEVLQLLDQWDIHDVQCDYRLDDGKSLDYYVPSHNIAIEYGGLYWHNEASPTPRTRNYHAHKQHQALHAGIRLITIFEDEWLQRRAQVTNVLKAIFGLSSRRLGARQCRLHDLEVPVAKAFLEAHHLQGAAPHVRYAVGLSHDDELVGVMTLGPHHRQGHGALVLNRLGFAADTNVAGGASRLFKAACTWARAQGHQTIISWSDNRWFAGGVYPQLGFRLAEELPPDYTYVVRKAPRERLSKQSQKKDRVDCPPGLTEHEWARQRGLARVWDCGHKRWEFTL